MEICSKKTWNYKNKWDCINSHSHNENVYMQDNARVYDQVIRHGKSKDNAKKKVKNICYFTIFQYLKAHGERRCVFHS